MTVKREKKEYLAHMAELVKSHPELQEKWVSLQTKVEKYQARKNSKD